MEVLDINTFLSFKTNEDVQELDSKTIELLNELFGSVDKNKKGKKFIKKPNVNILKNQKIQSKKENIVNRVNLILNKLSESNMDNLVIEFLENINQIDLDNWEEVQKTNLVENKLVTEKLIVDCDKLILEQKVFLPDIYHWFNSKTRDLTEQEKDKIKSHLKKTGITPRETVLLESLINKKIVKVNELATESKPKIKVEIDKSIKTDTLNLECENIIEEYILIKSLDDIKYFINNRCIDAISKNKFCENLIDRYFMANKENSSELIDLVKELIKTQTLFKSNLSRGLLLIHNSWKEKSIDYIKPTDKMKVLLTTMKSIGITKGIEFLIDQYKISVEVSK